MGSERHLAAEARGSTGVPGAGRRCGLGTGGGSRRPAFVLAAVMLAATACASGGDEGDAGSLRTDSRTPYVHRLTLYDEDGQAIDPTDDFAGPYSPRATCGKCHPYAQIATGWHFAPASADGPGGAKRRGEPWWWTSEKLGVTVALADHGWPQTQPTRKAGLAPWQLVKRFGSHMPGGGWGEPAPGELERSPQAARWRVSGPLEIDCMICHAADGRYDAGERARQIERENFKWAATAALGLAVVRGEAAKVPDDWDPLAEPDPDHPEQAGPKIEWDASRFDADNRVLFAITRRPPAERCWFCHTRRRVGAAHDVAEMLAPRDVHLAAGLTCVDCHRNQIDHRIVRGYPSEAQTTGQAWRAAYTCKGCHLGVADATDPALRAGGRYGAPRPAHRGLPPIHLEKLACTACHSGPRPELQPQQFQTARAHGLGLAERGRSATQEPLVYGPVFARRIDGKIAPHLEAWMRVYHRDGELVPIPEVERAWRRLGKAASSRKPEEIHAKLCDTLGKAEYSQYSDRSMAALLVLMREPIIEHKTGTRRSLFGENGPDVVRSPDMSREFALPRVWPIAHDVRPASQALGAEGCTDCHASDGVVFAGSILPPGGKPRVHITQANLRGEDVGVQAFWNWAFSLRPVFKIVALAGTVLLALMLLCGLIAGLVRPAAGNEPGPRAAGSHLWLHAVAIVAVILQAASGLGSEWMFGGVHAWALLFHMATAGLFIFALLAVGLLWLRRMLPGHDPALSAAQRWLFWVGLLLGWCIIVTMTLPMLPVLEPGQIAGMVEIHELCAILFVIVMVAHTVISWSARQARRGGTS